MPRFARVLLVLLAVWGVAAAVVWGVRAARPTPEKIQRYLAGHPLEPLPADRRAGVIDTVASRLNRLEFADRQTVQRTPEMRAFYDAMTDAERSRFLDLTLPEGFRQVMLALNKMTPEKRRAIVQRALDAIAKGGPPDGGEARPPVEEAMMQKIVGQGMSAFYEEANADVKLDFAPVIEQIQRSLQWRD